MDLTKTGQLIAAGRKRCGLTQKQLAQQLGVSDKAVSKWERGLSCPDVSLLTGLSQHLGINLEGILSGELREEDAVGGNMKQLSYYVCPQCGNLSLCTGSATVSCCGRPLKALAVQKPDEAHKLSVEQAEDDWFITSSHEMTKPHHISFVAFATGDQLLLVKQYPEWDLQVRIPRRRHGVLLWYCTEHGLYRSIL